jgi:hypothetical protein
VARGKKKINAALRRLGYQVKRVPAPPDPSRRIEELPTEPDPAELVTLVEDCGPFDRLMTAPTFILSSVRSGSTLLRLILDSHPDICSPQELHLRRIGVRMLGHGRYSLEQLGLNDKQLRFLLWDRILYRELQRSGKSQFVNKTPTDALMWSDIVACWPDARFVFLRRHPGAIVDSWSQARSPALSRDEVALDILAYATGMEQALRVHGGLVVRYEDLTADPETETRRLCEFIGVPWTPAMIDYGAAPHSGMKRGLGDWSPKMWSGRIQPAAPLPPPERIPDALRPIARAWGYLGAGQSVTTNHTSAAANR